ncbi:hypothetical protein DIQ79_24880 [Mycolicibacterium smegmatis]|nr:hypothetical protein EYS45_24185 [Mycolicibacterium smegmatis MC2 155]TBM44503.1 hypothetical protein DIQ86_16300 [Mycolicibacterium smegmatis]TBM48179.1 hypothetical protein DIQ85_24635 [Mycolicibacterium smegmatis]TBM57942.1 hypothetical protein DIQ83_24295 [Mycolicibacterium smegmatis]TBM65993.1 hypothetical protein DIQ82_24620 [Mycolicibacterium smegmatis]
MASLLLAGNFTRPVPGKKSGFGRKFSERHQDCLARPPTSAGSLPRVQVYVVSSQLRSQAVCDCGWSGQRRWLRGSAVMDASLHAGQTGHLPTSTPMPEDGRSDTPPPQPGA